MQPSSDTRTLAVPCELTQADFDRFAELSGDHNPIHVDPAYAARTAFGATVSHGMLLYSRLHALLTAQYPGLHVRSQDLMFPAPSYANEALSLSLEGRVSETGETSVRMQVRKPDGRLGLDGTATLAPQRAAPPPGLSAAPALETAALDAPGEGPPRFRILRTGDTAHVRRRFEREELDAWSALAGMTPPATDVPPPLVAALFSYLLGEELPGHGTNYLKQSLTLGQPALPGETLTAGVAVTRLRADKALVNLDTRCLGNEGRLICTGSALVLFAC